MGLRMKQVSFSEAEFFGKKRVTRRERLVAEMDHRVPWPLLVAEIEPFFRDETGPAQSHSGVEFLASDDGGAGNGESQLARGSRARLPRDEVPVWIQESSLQRAGKERGAGVQPAGAWEPGSGRTMVERDIGEVRPKFGKPSLGGSGSRQIRRKPRSNNPPMAKPMFLGISSGFQHLPD